MSLWTREERDWGCVWKAEVPLDKIFVVFCSFEWHSYVLSFENQCCSSNIYHAKFTIIFTLKIFKFYLIRGFGYNIYPWVRRILLSNIIFYCMAKYMAIFRLFILCFYCTLDRSQELMGKSHGERHATKALYRMLWFMVCALTPGHQSTVRLSN